MIQGALSRRAGLSEQKDGGRSLPQAEDDEDGRIALADVAQRVWGALKTARGPVETLLSRPKRVQARFDQKVTAATL